MTDPIFYIAMSLSALAGLAMLTMAALTGWRGWLDLQGRLLSRPGEGSGVPNASARIEIADLKERIRKLEAIAAGVDL